MLEIMPIKRYTSIQALSHKWFEKYEKIDAMDSTPINILENLKKFRTTTKMEQAAYMYIMTQLMSGKEKDQLQKAFQAMDANHDGQLSKDELIEGYTKTYGNRAEAETIVEEIMKTADPDGNGVLDYTEFLIATTNKKAMLSKRN